VNPLYSMLNSLDRVPTSLSTNNRQLGLGLFLSKGFPQFTELMLTGEPSGSRATLLATPTPLRKKACQTT
jgi:hypothetical protein